MVSRRMIQKPRIKALASFKSWSSLDKGESLACQITPPFNKKIGSFCKGLFLILFAKTTQLIVQMVSTTFNYIMPLQNASTKSLYIMPVQKVVTKSLHKKSLQNVLTNASTKVATQSLHKKSLQNVLTNASTKCLYKCRNIILRHFKIRDV